MLCEACSRSRIPLKRHFDGKSIEVIACMDCHGILFPRAAASPPLHSIGEECDEPEGLLRRVLQEYDSLCKKRGQIEALLAQYRDKLAQLNLMLEQAPFSGLFGKGQDEVQAVIDRQHLLGNEVESSRQTALLVMAHFESLARSLRDLCDPSDDKNRLIRRLQDEIFRAAMHFVQQNRFGLRLKLSELLLHRPPSRSSSANSLSRPPTNSVSRSASSTFYNRFQSFIEGAIAHVMPDETDHEELIFTRARRRPQAFASSDTLSFTSSSNSIGSTDSVKVANMPAMLQKTRVLAEQRTILEQQIEHQSEAESKFALMEALREVDDEMQRMQVAVARATPLIETHK